MSQNDKDNKQLSWSNPQNNSQQQGQQQNHANHNNQQHKQDAKPAAKPAVATVSAASTGRVSKIVGWLAVGVVAGVIVAWGATSLYKHNGAATTAGSLQNASTSGSTDTTGDSTMTGSGLLTVASPQKAGLEVSVSGVNVSEPTWVVVHESRQGKPGNVLGASLFFAGNTSGTIELLRGTVAGQTYFVTERADNGDHKFSLSQDQLVLTDGQPSWTTFSAN